MKEFLKNILITRSPVPITYSPDESVDWKAAIAKFPDKQREALEKGLFPEKDSDVADVCARITAAFSEAHVATLMLLNPIVPAANRGSAGHKDEPAVSQRETINADDDDEEDRPLQPTDLRAELSAAATSTSSNAASKPTNLLGYDLANIRGNLDNEPGLQGIKRPLDTNTPPSAQERHQAAKYSRPPTIADVEVSTTDPASVTPASGTSASGARLSPMLSPLSLPMLTPAAGPFPGPSMAIAVDAAPSATLEPQQLARAPQQQPDGQSSYSEFSVKPPMPSIPDSANAKVPTAQPKQQQSLQSSSSWSTAGYSVSPTRPSAAQSTAPSVPRPSQHQPQAAQQPPKASPWAGRTFAATRQFGSSQPSFAPSGPSPPQHKPQAGQQVPQKLYGDHKNPLPSLHAVASMATPATALVWSASDVTPGPSPVPPPEQREGTSSRLSHTAELAEAITGTQASPAAPEEPASTKVHNELAPSNVPKELALVPQELQAKVLNTYASVSTWMKENESHWVADGDCFTTTLMNSPVVVPWLLRIMVRSFSVSGALNIALRSISLADRSRKCERQVRAAVVDQLVLFSANRRAEDRCHSSLRPDRLV
jgi:hypothetical protein